MKLKRLFHAAWGALCLGSLLPMPAMAQDTALKWYKGNTHTHSSNSAGADSTPHELARWYRENGYQFVFITDHDHYLTDPEPVNALVGRRDWFLVLPGQEVGVSLKREGQSAGALHINSLFATQEIGHMQGEFTLTQAIAPVLEQGALLQINHPVYNWSLNPSDLDALPDGALIEVWNGLDASNNLGGDDGAGDVKPSAEGYWDYLLSRGKIVWGSATDDVHVLKGKNATPGRAWIVVRAAELTPAALRAAIETGNFYASNGVSLTDISSDDNSLTLTLPRKERGPRYTTHFIGQDGKLLAEVAGWNPSYRFTGTEKYVRATIYDSYGNRAWTQPVFLDDRAERVKRAVRSAP